MIREALDAGARHAFLHITREHGLYLKWRPTADDHSTTEEVIPHARLKLPITLRLTRRGDTITATTSTDGGRSFRPAGVLLRFVPPLAATVHVGLAITSCDPHQLAEARFNGLEVRPLPSEGGGSRRTSGQSSR
jgi:hypothetical protein